MSLHVPAHLFYANLNKKPKRIVKLIMRDIVRETVNTGCTK